ncbi:hypothetical protein K505DRAFT_342576 [Melanomma pulvis-pyrius CBS 109.77]|uniref:Uncharacterized protein n=1 Tax=Melanomma pulvis-pyrius CBS 109.77 TaxID=1314802 RepID=A0A6A6WUV3_9PLEO|nr:hypothetical protein K505DRAFT_342576 [Melanomma pulvis-pyrius CBS 109.77]
MDDQASGNSNAGSEMVKAQDSIMSEVADWLELNDNDYYWAPRRQLRQKVLFSWDKVIAHLTASSTSSTTTTDSTSSDALLHLIALQLLASCCTLQRASSATSFPLYQQRGTVRLVTSLKLHSQFRYSPAAGHHARQSSETSSWPGLYTGPSIEDRLAEEVSQRRRFKKRQNDLRSEPHLAILTEGKSLGNGWSDAPAPLEGEDTRRPSTSSASSKSASKRGLLSKLMCQTFGFRRSRRRHNFFSLGHLPSKTGMRPYYYQQSSTSIHHNRLSHTQVQPPPHAVQAIPSGLRLRRIQSTQKARATSPYSELFLTRRNSSTPTMGSPLACPYEIPEIRRISATTAEGWSPMSGRSFDMLTAKEYLDGTRMKVLDESKLNPSSVFVSQRRTSNPLIPASPMCSTEAVVPAQKIPEVDYFNKAVSFMRCDSGPAGCVDEDPYSNDGSIILDKRTSTVGRSVEFGPEWAQKLQRRTREHSNEEDVDDMLRGP